MLILFKLKDYLNKVIKGFTIKEEFIKKWFD